MRNLVFLPGWTKDRGSYKKLIKSMPSGFKVFIPTHEYLSPHKGLANFEKQLLKLFDDNSLDKVELAGHSFGGALAVYFASRHPERLEKLYLVDSMAFKEKLLRIATRSFRERIKINPYLNILASIELVKKPILNFKLAGLAINLNFKDELKKIKTPTTLIWGENDIITPIKNAEIIQQAIPDSRLFKLKNLKHDWIMYSPEYFWKNITF